MNGIILIGMPGMGEWILILLIFVVPGIFWLWALVDCLTNEFNGSNKIIWILVIILIPVLGSILYLTIGRSQKILREEV